MNILVLGGLGYVGSALSEILRNNRDDQIIIMDNRIAPIQIANMPEHFKFVQGDLEDLDLVKHLMRHAEVVHILAAQVEAESSVHREEAVWRDNFELPCNIIDACPKGVRITYPSSGNVFGGVDESEKYLDLDETDPPSPKYPYAETKREIEKYLEKSGKDYVAVRLGTNYGYAPAIRFNLVTNIFALRAIKGEPITIHGTGSNYRPTVCVHDAAKALDFLSRHRDASGEIFHVVNENQTIRELAQKVIDAVGSDTELDFIAKVVPFSAYGLSSAKLRGLGFKFDWTVKTAVQDLKRRLHAVVTHEKAAFTSNV